ncbi:hypothetical protein VTN00DRAFT_1152 [Thermoascus crustaceus]|uniref:uncharacterized protein n=1 Tax=Thermoascus crustaceus TaxID=5088 RepID=UPI00374360B8
MQVPSAAETANSSLWYWYLVQERDRKQQVRRAAGLASVAWMASDNHNQTADAIADPVAILLTDSAGVIEREPSVTGIGFITKNDRQEMGRIVLEQIAPDEPRFRPKIQPRSPEL